ncbi:MAG: WYL domain-containing protein [Candidatus Nanopelagicaceae bacterium]|nr:WYL domain-containing protein [Candidatus Nanopelagicaceae bacterium]
MRKKIAKKDSNPALDRTARLLDLVPYLATHQGISIEDLAKEFSISTSEVTDDLTTLWMCGLPGYTALELMDLSFESGFVTISNAETLAHPRTLDRNEVLTLILGLETMLESEASQRNSLSEQIASLIEKLSQFLDIARLIQAGTASSSAIRGEIDASINSRDPIQIEYHSLTRDEVTTRVIHPLEFISLADSNPHEYLYAFCELSNGYRTFRVDRILKTMSAQGVETHPRREINTAEPAINRIVVAISSRERDVAERFNLSPQNLREDSTKEVIVESFTPDWAIREIMSFGGEVSLKSPVDLRESLRQRSIRALGGYI